MSEYTPPDSLNVVLNFKKDLTEVDAHNVVLNFGVDDGFNSAEIQLNTAFSFNAIGTVEPPIDVHGSASIGINTASLLEALGTFDINFLRGLNLLSICDFELGLPASNGTKIHYGKPFFKLYNTSSAFDPGLTLSNAVIDKFEKTQVLRRSVQIVFSECLTLERDYEFVWQENDKRFIARTLVFEESEKLLINRETDWDEMIRKRKKITFSHEVAEVFEKRFTFIHDKGLELVTTDSIPWDVATAVYYRKSNVDPIEPQPLPEYVGTTNLNFVCLCHDIDSHNVILNFGADECLPNLAPVDWWYIVNEIKVTRLDNGQEIQIYSGDYSTDRSSWSWSYNLSIPFYEKSKTEPINGQPVILKIMINGNEHRMLLENISRSRQFGKDVYKLSGRSPTALLDAPYSPTRSFTQENERSSVQLVQAELDRVNSDVVLNWDLIDALGWILPPESLSYSNLTPIAAIKSIVEAAGGFIYSEPASNTLTIKPRYKKTWWDSIAVEEYDRVIPESIVTDQSTDYQPYPDYNGVFLTNDRTGDTGQVKRIGTAGDVLQESINSPLLTSTTVMHSKGREVLAKAGLVENHSLLMPITQEIGLCLPGELVAFNGDWWGIVDGVSGSFTHKLVNQTVSIERVNRE